MGFHFFDEIVYLPICFTSANNELRLDLGTKGLKLASRSNLKSGPQFAKVCFPYKGIININQLRAIWSRSELLGLGPSVETRAPKKLNQSAEITPPVPIHPSTCPRSGMSPIFIRQGIPLFRQGLLFRRSRLYLFRRSIFDNMCQLGLVRSRIWNR